MGGRRMKGEGRKTEGRGRRAESSMVVVLEEELNRTYAFET